MARSSGYCRARGCSRPCLPSTHSPMCSAHRHAFNRWGNAHQTALRQAELEPLRKQVREAIHRNPTSKAWVILAERWSRIVAYAQSVEAARQSGAALSRYEAQAAAIIRSAAGSSRDATEVIEEVFAVYLLQAARPSRFQDDRSFRFALAHRVRRLAPLAAGSYYCPTRRRTVKVYRDVAIRVMDFLGMWTAGCFGVGALQFIDSERERIDAPTEEARQLAAAMRSLR